MAEIECTEWEEEVGEDEDDATTTTRRTRRTTTVGGEVETGTEKETMKTTLWTAPTGYKGKALRSWPQLPPEVVRLIASFYLHAAARAPLPAPWAFPAPPGAHVPPYARALGAFPSTIYTHTHTHAHAPGDAYHHPDTHSHHDDADAEGGDTHHPRTRSYRHAAGATPGRGAGDEYEEHYEDEDDEEDEDASDPGAAEAQHQQRAAARFEAARRAWEARAVFSAARGARALERVMGVCPGWGRAVESHPFWDAAITLFDPLGLCAEFAWHRPPPDAHSHSSTTASGAATRLSPYRHFRAILTHTCLPCRLNAPLQALAELGTELDAYAHTVDPRAAPPPPPPPHPALALGAAGLGTARRSTAHGQLGTVALCRSHAGPRRERWCGVCLRDGELAAEARAETIRAAAAALARAEGTLRAARVGTAWERARRGVRAAREALVRAQAAAAAAGGAGAAGVWANEDEATFTAARATCRWCRGEWLWRGALAAAESAPAGPGATPESVWVGVGRRGRELLGALGASPLSAVGVLAPPDGVVRAAVAAFVEEGRAGVGRVLGIAGERGWLRGQTRWAALMGQAVAARRFEKGGSGMGGREGPGYGRPYARGEDYTGVATVRYVESRARARSPELDAPAAYLRQAGAMLGLDEVWSDDDDDEYEEYESELEAGADGDMDAEAAAALEMSVRDLALGDWARARILDGAWVAPADLYYGVRVGGLDGVEAPVRAVHPVAWAVSAPASPAGDAGEDGDGDGDGGGGGYPGARSDAPPTFALAEAAHAAHGRQLRAVLLPALRNVVRRVVVECGLDAEERAAGAGSGGRGPLDPAVRAARMGMEEVVRELREEEGVWFDGVDWRERRRNARAEAEARREGERDGGGGEGEKEREGRRHRGEGSDDSSERGSRASDTSPVLSTSTLGTTPSPPPLDDHKHKDNTEERQPQPTIAVMPVLESPRLLRPIPHVPETIAHLPPYSLEALRAVWREACEPLYHCRCTVCERAMAVAQAAQGGSPVSPSAPRPTKQYPREHGAVVLHLPAEDEGGRGADSVVALVDDDGEEDIDEPLSPRSAYWAMMDEQEGPGAYEREMRGIRGNPFVDDDDEEEEGEGDEGYSDGGGYAGAGTKYAAAPTGRKRSVEELEPESDGEGGEARGGTPPKRARTGEREPGVRLVKRRSPELDEVSLDGEEADVETGTGRYKRARLAAAESPPDTTSTPSTLDVASGEESACEAR
ncbi:hypothetical protein B0H15DRAFT_928473 [Mycena belliarum]|uniref:Uncharacterized protein n=1 Tax=Mycena belliarum TaxID=1033014 RepID=A0AAD6XYB3_9AGAR|nr:hypothetical protein B0H15DRAFT_928473 [Mycena belliae]